MIGKFVENTVNNKEGQFRRLIFGIRLMDGSVIPVKGRNFKGETVTFTYEKLINDEWIEIAKPESFTPKLLEIEDLIKNNNQNSVKVLSIKRRLKERNPED